MKYFFIIIFLRIGFTVAAQVPGTDIASLENPEPQWITGTFRSTRVINAHSVEMLHKGDIDVRILHRFGYVNGGLKQFFGLDDATMRMGMDYGLGKNLMVGLGRSTFRKEVDIFLKSRFLQQRSGSSPIPLSLLLAAGAQVWTEESFGPEKPSFGDRTSFYFQLLMGRRFNRIFSLQLSPVLLINRSPVLSTDEKAIFALGGGARWRLSNMFSLTLDYHHPFSDGGGIYTRPLAVGLDIETGGHVFQLHFTNATGTNERAYLTETTGDYFKGDIRFGFNLSRIFSTRKAW